MIERIDISNYALIDKTVIQPGKGFSVITGETGAGKSILIGAIGLTLGQRAEMSAIMDKNKKCVVEILYNVSGYRLKPWFEENDLDYSEEVTVRREITADGKSRGFINDTPVNNKILKEFGSYLIDIHSQHQSLLVGQPEYQTNILDVFCQNEERLATYREYYRLRREKLRQLQEAREEAENAAKEEDYLKFRFSQLESARLREGEKEELEAELALLSNAESIKSGFSQLTNSLRDTDNAVISVLKNVKNTISRLKGIVREEEEYEERLNSVILELNDLADEAERKAGNVEFNPGRMEEINGRLNVIYDLMFKYKAEDVKGLIAVREELDEKLKGIQSSSDRIEALEKELQVLEKAMKENALEIHRARERGEGDLTKEMKSLLKELGIKHAEFVVSICDTGVFTATGTDEVKFLFAANKNQLPGEIAKVASGGEISRVMLSLKYVLSRNKQLPVIVFDEIDTGLSGEVAHKMARMMQEMSERMQVISISHLPQIAAAGKSHFKVYKEDDSHATVSRIRLLDYEERMQEIAAMISGSEITQAALETAKNLLNS